MKKGILIAMVIVSFSFSTFTSQAQGGNLKDTVARLNMRFASCLGKGDAAGVANIYATDAEVMEANRPVLKGRDNIGGMFRSMVDEGVTNITLTTVAIWNSGSVITEEGIYTLKSRDGQFSDVGKYIVVWKQENGQWKIYRDIFNSDGKSGK